MSTLLSITHRTMNMSEYENFVHSIKPLPMAEAKTIETLVKRLRQLLPMLIGFDAVGLGFVLKSFVIRDLSATEYILLALFFLMMCIPLYIVYRMYKRYSAFLIPYGLTVFEVSTKEIQLNDYRKLSTVTSRETLTIIKSFIEFRNGALIVADIKALKLDEYFQIDNSPSTYSSFLERRTDLVKQILLKVEDANL